ncbi:ATP-dependent RNA helicase DbpA [Agarilytica rhodophyticola]|uniref:ATP-dependent RNA helicase DbpA n=1 Tax=Agarilytica rhodophyticola TaxID=1737490 RepID=UPI000B348585|nr:ATP-dependent RNA helicase DbpA [Agarilytica rhodophyticola]
MKADDFSSLKLPSDLSTNLASLGYNKMTPIQERSLPPILAGEDVIAQAKTGSGKTAAFGLGILAHLQVKRFCVQSLVLCPTRELADQVAKEIRRLARTTHNVKVLTLCGGMPFGPQIGSLEHGAHIVVGTPGRVEEHVRKGTLKLNKLNILVLDEADRMLEMGFQEALDAIIANIPNKRQTLLFSATYPAQIQSIATRIMHKPVTVQVEATHDHSNIQQRFFKVESNEQRLTALRLLLLNYQAQSSVIFCNTKRDTQTLVEELRQHGFSALALHGDLEQKERDQTLVRFANKSVSILVATDVAARGLDIDNLDAVFNYHIARDLEVHVHRVGRTGRAGKKGIACSLYTQKESYKLSLLEEYIGREIQSDTLPPKKVLEKEIPTPSMATLQIDGGKKQKVRPGDILGALTAQKKIKSENVGKIHIFDYCAYVAVNRQDAKLALKIIAEGKLKGRSFRVRRIRG